MSERQTLDGYKYSNRRRVTFSAQRNVTVTSFPPANKKREISSWKESRLWFIISGMIAIKVV